MALKEKYMGWINKFTKSIFNLFAGNVLEGFQPIDFFHFYPLWYDLWVERVAGVIKKLDLESKSYQELKGILSVPSNMRAQLQKLIPTYQGVRKNQSDFKVVANFFARMLEECCPSDPFAETKNLIHSSEQMDLIMNSKWQSGDVLKARKIGQLITTIGSLGHGLYNDLGVDFCWDAYGPYKVSEKGENFNLLIRHFPNLCPKELWPDKYLTSVKEISIYALYQDVEWVIPFVGCHASPLSGSIVQGLKKYFVMVDGVLVNDEKVNNLISEFAQKAEALYKDIKKLSFEELKIMVMNQECYQLKKLFDSAGVDWKPTEEMLNRIRDKQLLTGILPHGIMMTDINEYEEIFGIKLFDQEVLNK